MSRHLECTRCGGAGHLAKDCKLPAWPQTPQPEQRPPNCGTGFCSCIECPTTWAKAEEISNLPTVDEAIRTLLDDNTADNATAVVQAALAAAAPPGQQAPLEDGPPGSGGWKAYAGEVEKERDYWRQRAQTMFEHQRGEVWYWQGDGNDYPESMCNSLPVVIRADALRELLAAPTPPAQLTQAATDVLAERRRQIESEGWTSAHDDEYLMSGSLAEAAACYAISSIPGTERRKEPPHGWPWAIKWWKPTTPRRDLVKAGALILAEIERLDRQAATQGTQT